MHEWQYTRMQVTSAAIDANYDIAISTAAAALDYIVVDDTPAAQRCVELLRARKLGVATFLILDKQAHLAQKAAEKVSPPEGAPQLCGDAHVQTVLLLRKSPQADQAPAPQPSAHDAYAAISLVLLWRHAKDVRDCCRSATAE